MTRNVAAVARKAWAIRRGGVDEKQRRERQAIQRRVADEQRNSGGWRETVDCGAQADHHPNLREKQQPNCEWVAVEQVQHEWSAGGIRRDRAGHEQAGGHPGIHLAQNAALAQLRISTDKWRWWVRHQRFLLYICYALLVHVFHELAAR